MTAENTKIDWNDWLRIDETWYVAGFACTLLDEDMLRGRGDPKWTLDDMNQMFLNRAEIQRSTPYKIKWDAFHQKYGSMVYRLGRGELLQAVLAFSNDECIIKATDDYYFEVKQRLGVELKYHGDRFSSFLPDFYYDSTMRAEDFFFDEFLPLKLSYTVVDAIKFAAWVLRDYRWRVIVTVDSL